MATFKVLVSALGALFGQKIANHPWIIRFLKSTKRLQLCIQIRSPFWDFSILFQSLCIVPLEPISEVPLRLLAQKSVLLVAITSARRLGKLAAFSVREPYYQILVDRIMWWSPPSIRSKRLGCPPSVLILLLMKRDVFIGEMYVDMFWST